MRTVILSLAILLIGLRPTSMADDFPWPRHTQPIYAQATRSIPCVREFLYLYPSATMGFFTSGSPSTLYLYLVVGLYQRHLVSLNIPIQLSADRCAIKSWKEPYLQFEDVGEISVSSDHQGYTMTESSLQKLGYDRFKILKEHGGDFTAIGIHVIQDEPRKNFDRVWRPGHPDYVLQTFTLSRSGRYGVQLPVAYFEGLEDKDDRKNRVVEVSTGRVVAVLDADPGFDRRLNWHQVMPPRWSSDESLLLWGVEGKWSPHALVVLKLRHGQQAWQLDLLKTAQQALLSRTRKAAPEQYLATKREHVGYGSAYPDGFTVDVTADGEEGGSLSLPLPVQVNLTADPKLMIASPKNLESWLDGVVTEEGKFVVKRFHLGQRPGYQGR